MDALIYLLKLSLFLILLPLLIGLLLFRKDGICGGCGEELEPRGYYGEKFYCVNPDCRYKKQI